MNLLDHFRGPVETFVGWPAVHGDMAGNVAFQLNRSLVLPWRAEGHLHTGFEVDVAGERRTVVGEAVGERVPPSWEPPPADAVVPLNPLPIEIEVEVFQARGGRRLVGAIEFVSPANKHDAASRGAFAAKCEALLARGVGVMIVDLCTERRGSLHATLMHRCGDPAPADDPLYAAAYHPLTRGDDLTADLWYRELAVGRPLPALPLFLLGGPCLKVDLQAAYDLTLDRLNLPRDLAEAGVDPFAAPTPNLTPAENAATPAAAEPAPA